MVEIAGNRLNVGPIEAIDGTPVVDVKPTIAWPNTGPGVRCEESEKIGRIARALSMVSPTFLDTLHQKLLWHALIYFFPESTVDCGPSPEPPVPELAVDAEGEHAVTLDWLGVRHRMQRSAFAFTDHDHRMLRAIGRYLSARHRLANQASDDPGILRLFGGRAEDHVVSAWLDQAASGDAPTRSNAERIDDAVEVLRACALGTYENRRITMGALLLGGLHD